VGNNFGIEDGRKPKFSFQSGGTKEGIKFSEGRTRKDTDRALVHCSKSTQKREDRELENERHYIGGEHLICQKPQSRESYSRKSDVNSKIDTIPLGAKTPQVQIRNPSAFGPTGSGEMV